MSEHFPVIIVGGRPAGAGLAIRLGPHNIKTLLVDKANFPSPPSVPSGPIIYNQHLDLLEELGFSEDELFHEGGRIDSFAVEYVNCFSASWPVSVAEVKRPYAYATDRMKFDAALWEHASRAESVTARSGFAVTGILREDGKVIGIKGQTERGKEETFIADLVVGADGCYSFVAQQVKAATLAEFNDHLTSTYFASWENVGEGLVPHDNASYMLGNGFMILMIPFDTRKYIVATYMRMDHHSKAEGRIEAFYHESLEGVASVAKRLKDAQQITPIVGMKGIKNGYRQPIGDGWALVGDAYHYKDPIDGQGIYDALLQSKMLVEAIHDWHSGSKSWQDASQEYMDNTLEVIQPMLRHTVRNIKQTLYTNLPPFMIKTMIRWLTSNPEFQRDFMRVLSRASDPDKFPNPNVIPRAIIQGIKRDLFGCKHAER